MTITVSEFLQWVTALSALAVAVGLFRLLGPAIRVTRELEVFCRSGNELRPQIDRLLHEAEGGLSELHQAARRADGIAADLQAITSSTRQLALLPLRRLGALALGAKVGMEAFHRLSEAVRGSANKNGGMG